MFSQGVRGCENDLFAFKIWRANLVYMSESIDRLRSTRRDGIDSDEEAPDAKDTLSVQIRTAPQPLSSDGFVLATIATYSNLAGLTAIP